MLHRGYLSGRVTRDEKKIEGTRMEWAGAKAGRAMHSHPDPEWFSDDKQVWSVIDKCTEIAKKKSELGTLWL